MTSPDKVKFRLLKQLLIILSCFFIIVLICPDRIISQQTSKKKAVQTKSKQGVQFKEWTFGTSKGRNDNIWRRGMDGKSIMKKSTPANSNKQHDVVNADINIMARNPPQKPEDSLGISFSDESSSWKVTPSQKINRPDEERVRDKRHIVRAYAPLHKDENLSVTVGPELILKDDYKGDKQAKTNQPDSSLGVGMKFKYGF